MVVGNYNISDIRHNQVFCMLQEMVSIPSVANNGLPRSSKTKSTDKKVR